MYGHPLTCFDIDTGRGNGSNQSSRRRKFARVLRYLSLLKPVCSLHQADFLHAVSSMSNQVHHSHAITTVNIRESQRRERGSEETRLRKDSSALEESNFSLFLLSFHKRMASQVQYHLFGDLGKGPRGKSKFEASKRPKRRRSRETRSATSLLRLSLFAFLTFLL